MTDTGVVNIHGRDYQTVAKRIKDFRADHPTWRILTDLVSADDTTVLMKASIADDDGTVLATGYAEENRNRGINKTSAIENAETSAVGRALAILGYGGTQIASADEMRSADPVARPETLAALRDHLEAMTEELTPAQLAFFEAHPVDEMTEAQATKILAKLRKAK